MESAFEVTAIANEEAYELTFPLPGRAFVFDGPFARVESNSVHPSGSIHGRGGEKPPLPHLHLAFARRCRK